MANPENIDELEITGINAADVQREIEDIVKQLEARKPDDLKGINPTDFRAASGYGVDPVTTILIIFAGAIAKEAGTTVWRKFIWPSLELRLKGKVKKKSH